MKYIKISIILIFIFKTFLFGETFILKTKQANSYKEFLKYYKKIDNITVFSSKGNKYHIIPNRIHRFHYLKKGGKVESLDNSFSDSTDPLLSQQEWLKIINGFDLINLSKGDGIVVGLLDSGVELDHEDLKGQFLKYYNVAENSTDVSDGFGHGTSVAGIIGAIANNGIGIRGVAPDIKFVVAKINVGASPTFDDFSVAKAIYYLVDNGAKVINMSIQMSQSNEAIEDAINYAEKKGVILVAASGNSGNDEESYPASNSYVLGVGSVDDNFKKSDFTDYDDKIFIMAPGENVLTTYINNEYQHETGTSFSAPIVTGIIADILSLNPYLTLNDIKNIILYNAFNGASDDYKVVNLSDSILGTGVKFALSSDVFYSGDFFNVSILLPPFSQSFDFYFGFILPDGKIAVLQYSNHFYYDEFNDNSLPTCSISSIPNYTWVNVYGGENSIFPPLELSGDLQYGDYQICSLYRKNNRILGYVKCRKFQIFK